MKYQRMLRNLLSYASTSCEEDVIESNKLYEELLAHINEYEALKRDVAIFKDTLNSIKAICNEPSSSMILSLAEISKRYIKIDNLINTYEEKLSKVGKEE